MFSTVRNGPGEPHRLGAAVRSSRVPLDSCKNYKARRRFIGEDLTALRPVYCDPARDAFRNEARPDRRRPLLPTYFLLVVLRISRTQPFRSHPPAPRAPRDNTCAAFNARRLRADASTAYSPMGLALIEYGSEDTVCTTRSPGCLTRRTFHGTGSPGRRAPRAEINAVSSPRG